MANRVLAGNRSTGGYGFYVSKSNSDVLSCDRKELLFDSSQGRSGEIYAGGSQSTLTGEQSFLSTGSKSSLGYIPLVIHVEDKKGEFESGWQDLSGPALYIRETAMLETTTSSIRPVEMYIAGNDDEYAGEDGVRNGRSSGYTCTNIKFIVVKIPCAYGYMTSTYF
jgi:hypothetical protein